MVVASRPIDRPVEMFCENTRLQANLHIPAMEPIRGVVVFAHGSGSSRFSLRNQLVARVLQNTGLATLLLDLLSPEEENDAVLVFDVKLLADRLVHAIDWFRNSSAMSHWPIGLFGAGTGAGAALIAAGKRPDSIKAVVCRGGRPDLAEGWISQVDAPTLLIVGGADKYVLDLNRRALAWLNCDKELKVIPGATHLFPESGAMDEVAELACDWFKRHLNGNEAWPLTQG